ncbi:MAG: hypothetical protein IPM24_12665 [Bryobacterales bacterium]|nr:hypothetical protein [Bryobacterales bacterium]
MRNELIAGFLLAAACAGQPPVELFRAPTDGADLPYSLYVPPDYDARRAYPLIVTLHDLASNHAASLRQVFGVEALAPGLRGVRAPLPDRQYLVLAPQARPGAGWRGIGETDLFALLERVETLYRVDPDRVYLTGAGMGAAEALRFAVTRPGRWAAVALASLFWPDGREEEAAPFAGNAAGAPYRLVHGQNDPVAPPVLARAWHRRLLAAGAQADYFEYPRVRHNAWMLLYRDGGIFDWFAQFRRDAFPVSLKHTTARYEHRRSRWLEITRLTPGETATAEARFTGPNRMEVSTSGVRGVTFHLARHPLFVKDKPLTVLLDGHVITAKGTAFSRVSGAWRAGDASPEAGQKRDGAEGPLPAGVSRRHIYVHGDATKEWAVRASQWPSAAFDLADGAAAVPADADLVVFGTAGTNPWLARHESRLPVALQESAADYGLLFVTSLDGRYVTVNSGIPWWQGLEPGSPAQLLPEQVDFVLFRGSLRTIVVSGRFDEDWKLPAEAAAKMVQTGAVRMLR